MSARQQQRRQQQQRRGLREAGGGGVCPRLHLACSPLCHPGPKHRAKPAQPQSVSARSPTRPGHSAHTARTRNGHGREPEQPVQHGLPSRPLVTRKLFVFILFPTLANGVHKQSRYSARSPSVCGQSSTPPHRQPSHESKMIGTTQIHPFSMCV